MRDLHVVFVSWIDSETSDGWGDYLDDEHDGLAYTCGIYLGETDNFIVIAHSVDEHYSNGRIAIPITAVKDMRTICLMTMPS